MSRPVATSERSYRAPALEKGLDVLELLAGSSSPLTTQAIADALSRSRSEIFRMVSVLEERGYITRDSADAGFTLTTRLLELAMRNAPTRGLLDAALPEMERLAAAVEQSCHLAVASDEDMVVIARVESPDEVGFAVRIGHRRPLVESTSGRVLLAFRGGGVDRELARELARVRRNGFLRASSSYVSGIVDLGAPVFDARRAGAAAALTIPYVQKRAASHPIAEVIEQLKGAAASVSAALGGRAP